MAQEVMAAFAKYTLDIAEFKANAAIALDTLRELKAESADPIVANFSGRGLRPTQPRPPTQPTSTLPTAPAAGGNVAAAAGQAATSISQQNAAVNQLASNLSKLDASNLRTIVSQRRYKDAIDEINRLIPQYQGNLIALNQLKQAEQQIDRAQAAQNVQTAQQQARLAADSGQYAAALRELDAAMVKVGADTREGRQLALTANQIRREETKSINEQTDAYIKRQRAQNQPVQALRTVNAAQTRTAPDSTRGQQLATQEAEILNQLAREDEKVANSAIALARAEGQLATALALVNTELGVSTNSAARNNQLKTLAKQLTNEQIAEEQRHNDSIRKQLQIQGLLNTALLQNRAEQGKPTTTGARRDSLKTEEAQIVQRLQKANEDLATSEIRAANAAGQYGTALAKITSEQGRSTNSAKRVADLKRLEEETTRAAARAADAEATSKAKVLAQNGNYVQSLTTIDRQLRTIAPGTQRYNALLQQYNQIAQQATAQGNRVTDEYIKQARAVGDLSKALSLVAAEQKKSTNTPARDAQLETQRVRIMEELNQAQIDVGKSGAGLSAQQKDYAAAASQIGSVLATTNLTTDQRNKLLRLQQQYVDAAKTADNQLADAEIRAAKGARDWTQAQALLNAEIAKAKAGGDTTRATNLQADLNRILFQQNGGLALLRAGWTRLAGPVALAAAAYQLFSTASRKVSEGIQLAANLDLQRRQVGGLVNSVRQGNEAFAAGIEFGQKFGFTMKEMGDAAADAAILLQTTEKSAEDVFNVLARLQARAPGKTFNDAVRAVAELQAGQVQSIQRIFNVPTTFTARLTKEIENGRDPIEALDDALTDLGISTGLLGERMKGTAGAITRNTLATEQLFATIGEILGGPAAHFLDWLSSAESGITGLLKSAQGLARDGVPSLQDFMDATAAARDAQRNQGGLSAITLGGQASPINGVLTGLAAMIGASKAAHARLQDDSKATAFSYDELRKRVTTTAPALKSLLDGNGTAGGGASKALESTAAQADRTDRVFNSLINKFNQGQISAKDMAARMKELRGELTAQDDQLGIVEAVRKNFPKAADQVEELQASLVALQSALGDPKNTGEFGDAIRGEIQAVSAELAALQAKMPIEITLEMKLERMDALKGAFDAIADGRKQLDADMLAAQRQYQTDSNSMLNEALNRERDYQNERKKLFLDYITTAARAQSDFDEQQRRALRDFQQGQDRGERDYNQQLQRGARDFAQSRDRATRDFNRSEQRATEEHNRSIARMQDDARKQDKNAEREYRRDLLRIQRDYDIDASRRREDFEEDRLRLLAEGRRYEAELLTNKFNKDEKRNQEDLSRGKSDRTDDYTQGIQDRTNALNQQINDANEAFARQRAQAKEDFLLQQQDAADAYAQQVADAAAAHAQQVADAKAAFAQQTADAKAAFAQQQKDADNAYVEQAKALKKANDATKAEQAKARVERALAYADERKTLVADFNKLVDDQIDALKRLADEQTAILKARADGFSEQEARAIGSLESSLTEFTRITAQGTQIAGLNGYAMGIQYIESAAQGMLDAARGLRQGTTQPPSSRPGGAGGSVTPSGGGGSGGGSFGGDPLLSSLAAGIVAGGGRGGDGYSAPRPGTTGMHYGVDIQANEGASINSPIDGTVVRVSAIPSQPWAGVSIEIEDKYGRQWYFGHVKWPLVKVGQRIKKGQKIATISDARHVHVQLRPGKGVTPIDPTPVLEDIAAGGTGAPAGAGGGSTQPPSSRNAGGQVLSANNLPRPPRTQLLDAGYSDGAIYGKEFARAAGEQTAALLAIQSQPSLAQFAATSVGGAGGAGGTGTRPVIQLSINLGLNAQMDGVEVGKLVAPTVISAMADGMDVQADIVATSNSVALQQPVFRSSLNGS